MSDLSPPGHPGRSRHIICVCSALELVKKIRETQKCAGGVEKRNLKQSSSSEKRDVIDDVKDVDDCGNREEGLT